MFYGFRDGRVFVRLDGPAPNAAFTVEFEHGPTQTRSATGRVVELEARIMGPRFRICVEHNGLPMVTLPADGWIDVA